MDLKAILASVIAGVSVFTFFSLPILREMYGDIALLAVYGGLGLLASTFVYLVVSKLTKLDFSRFSTGRDEDNNQDSDDTPEESVDGEDLVNEEMETLKNN